MRVARLHSLFPFLRRMACALLLGGAALTTHAAAAEAPTAGRYLINPGDVLQVTVWKQDTLDREVLVLPDGSISFPLVGDMMAKGLTVSQLEAALRAKVDSYIPDATVTVMVKAVLGNVVSVIGQVAKPGEIVLSHSASVMQALSIAGGLTPYADHAGIIVLRRSGGREHAIAFPYDQVARGTELDRDIELQPGDVIVVPTAHLF